MDITRQRWFAKRRPSFAGRRLGFACDKRLKLREN
jgi:hypothetical protein